MTDPRAIAEALLAACLKGDHKPGKVQFTKYLYLIDYCHWRYSGKTATGFDWKFYHYGPWCERAEDCMASLADSHGFFWRENEFTLVKELDMPEPTLPLPVKNFISWVVRSFKDKDLNTLLNCVYTDTEPMLKAHRGDLLDFHFVPVDKQMPVFFPVTTQTSFALHPAQAERMQLMRQRTQKLRNAARVRAALRQTQEYQEAVRRVEAELSSDDPLPTMRGRFSTEAANAMEAGE
jgi:hypothetical protein